MDSKSGRKKTMMHNYIMAEDHDHDGLPATKSLATSLAASQEHQEMETLTTKD